VTVGWITDPGQAGCAGAIGGAAGFTAHAMKMPEQKEDSPYRGHD